MSPIIKGRFVCAAHPEAAPARGDGVRPSRTRASHEKRLELLRIGQRVHALELTCSCGEVTLVELDYPEDSASETES